MKYFFIAGEASGDLHAAKLVREIKTLKPQSSIQGWGGDDMDKAGCEVLKHIDQLAFMGFAEVFMNLPTILGNFSLVKKQIEAFQPDALVLVDYPGFNMRIAKWAKKKGYRIIYYIAPQAWAWKAKRVKQLKAYVDEMYVILPFEKKWFEDRGMKASYLGHPLMDSTLMEKRDHVVFRKNNELGEKPIIALLPGSRMQELRNMEEVFIGIAQRYDDYQFVVAGAPGRQKADYKNYIDSNIDVVFEQTYDLLHASDYALVTSGTATLETALIGTPLIVCYRTSAITYFISKSLIKIPYISLVNLVAGKKIVPELIQHECTVDSIALALEKLMKGEDKKQMAEFETLKQALGTAPISRQIANAILNNAKH